MREAKAVTEPILVTASIGYTTHDNLARYASTVELRLHDDELVYSFMGLGREWMGPQKKWDAKSTTRSMLEQLRGLTRPDLDVADLRPPAPDQIEWLRSKLARRVKETK